MKKLLYLFLGVAGAVVVKSVLDRLEQERLEGALPRPVPETFNGGLSAEDELLGPVTEI